MKHTLLIALLGATVTLAVPSISFADDGYKFKSAAVNQRNNKDYNKRYHKNNTSNHRSRSNTARSQQAQTRHTTTKRVITKHNNNQKKFVAKPPKPQLIINQIKRDLNNKRNTRHDKRQFVKNNHGNNNKHRYNDRNHRNDKSSFSITWNVGDSNISYGNDWKKGRYNRHRNNQGKIIYQRIHKQQNRIQHGKNTGQLVKRELKSLRHEQRNIKQTLSHYKRDGHLNRYESSKLHQLLDVASNNIHRKSNNRLTRYTRHHDQYVQF